MYDSYIGTRGGLIDLNQVEHINIEYTPQQSDSRGIVIVEVTKRMEALNLCQRLVPTVNQTNTMGCDWCGGLYFTIHSIS